MKKLFLLAAILIASSCFGQFDTLVLVNGSRKAVIIKEIGDKSVKYKLPADSLGDTYVIKKSLVEKFILKSGCIDLKEQGYDNCVKDPTFGVIQGKDFTRTIISADLMQLIAIQHFQFNVEHILKNRKAGIELFCNMGLRDRNYPTDYKRKEITINPVTGGRGYYKFQYYGLNLKIYPLPHKKATYWLALGGELGKASTFITSNEMIPAYWDPAIMVPNGPSSTKYYETNYYNYHFNNGFNFRPHKHIVIQTHFDIGINQFKNPQTLKPNFSFKYGLGVMLGIAF